MAWWYEVEAAEPAFALRVRERFNAFKHSTLATLRKDGSPRVSVIELDFDGSELWFGCIPGSSKVLDLRRDPRLSLHCSTADIPDTDQGTWVGDAKIAGTAHEITSDTRRYDSPRFRIDITQVTYIAIAKSEDHLILETWHPDRGLLVSRR